MKNKLLFATTMSLALLILISSCSPSMESHKFSFDLNYEESANQVFKVKSGEKATRIPDPIREGFTFLNWFTTNNNSTVYDFTKPVYSDKTVYAHWENSVTNSLPRMYVNLKDASGNTINIDSVQRDPYVNGTVSLYDESDVIILNEVPTEFKGRGNGSWEEDKKGYRFKFNEKQSIFGQPSSRHWAIIACQSAQFPEGTLLKNATAYNMARDVLTNIEYTTSTKSMEVYFNGYYHGVYLLTEHVRVDTGRVDIPSQFGVLDTGYLVEYDSYADYDAATNTSLVEGIHYFSVPDVKYKFTVKSPDPDDYWKTDKESKFKEQVAYIRDYVKSVYAAALRSDYSTFVTLADLPSFVDMYILHEFFKNTDTGWSSFYMYKKPSGLLYAGPAWDFDATAGSSRGDSSPEGIYVADTILSREYSAFTSSELFINLYKSSGFKNAVRLRWAEIVPDVIEYVNHFLSDAFFENKKSTFARNFVKWRGMTQSDAETYWYTSCINLRTWLLDRAAWLTEHWA